MGGYSYAFFGAAAAGFSLETGLRDLVDLAAAAALRAAAGFLRPGPRFRVAPTIVPAAAPIGPAMAPPMTAPATARMTRRRRRRFIAAVVSPTALTGRDFDFVGFAFFVGINESSKMRPRCHRIHCQREIQSASLTAALKN
jgi:hypothetical protein